MNKLIIFYINIIFFMMSGVVFADVVSKNPNYLKTDEFWGLHKKNLN